MHVSMLDHNICRPSIHQTGLYSLICHPNLSLFWVVINEIVTRELLKRVEVEGEDGRVQQQYLRMGYAMYNFILTV